ncbi:uncharacterized protein ACR2FA_009449 [Aphomia sociella]
MRKSEKKIKSDRINALRKQYDEFLEEDKRRKERNEYILGRLDKMRYCTAMVQIRHKPTIVPNRDVYEIPPRQQESSIRIPHTNRDFMQLNIPRSQINETSLLKEISKKYILIPKNMPGFDNHFTQVINTNVDDSSDWKSKYDILEKLKNNEKESEVTSCKENNIQNNRSLNNINIEEQEKPQSNSENPERLIELQEKEYDTNSYETQLYQDLPDQNTSNKQTVKQDNYWDTTTEASQHSTEKIPEKIPNKQLNQSLSDPVHHDNKHIINSLQDNSKLEENIDIQPVCMSMSKLYETPEKTTEWDNHNDHDNSYLKSDHPSQESMTGDHYSPSTEKEINSETENNIYSNEGDEAIIPVINSDELVKQANMDVHVDSSPQVQNVTEYSNEVVNVQEDYIPNQNLELQVDSNEAMNVQEDYIPNQNLELQVDSKINPDEHNDIVNQFDYNSTHQYDPNSAIIQNVENPIDTSGIEAFDTEQREMFYSEQIDQNYPYNQDDGANVYNQEYTTQNENYQENQENDYYEGADTEQVYSAEINEHEEAPQRYDPNYEQQYGVYESQQEHQGYEQDYVQPQEYETETVNEEEFHQQQFEQHQETQETIEEQLDNEQGYIEKQNEHVEVSNVEKSPNTLQTE